MDTQTLNDFINHGGFEATKRSFIWEKGGWTVAWATVAVLGYVTLTWALPLTITSVNQITTSLGLF